MTLRQTLKAAGTRLSADPHLHATASRDAELLLLHTLELSRATLLAYPEREITDKQQSAYEQSILRRLQHEPVQYITGQQEFYGLPLHVTRDVLIPRPETEHLVEAVLHRLPPGEPLQIADIGTGSGAIAIALAIHLPRAIITALDLSLPALAVAQSNAVAHKVDRQIRFVHSDLLDNLDLSTGREHADDRDAGESAAFDAIVSNPPYISATECDTLHPQVRNHEPHAALFAGASGLEIYERLVPQAWHALKPHGLLALEIGHGQQQALARLLSDWE
ncbi:MAG: peptide chain release factor N(5)-glutamine methyltransferase, partial [Acidobacteriota bacterium]|nr:peptide chain release factor N(5)-glutamine methyltransferase [Acidobacteriota bacterium]